MNTHQMQVYTYAALAVVAAVVMALLLWPYIGALAVAVTLAVLFRPVYRRVLKALKYRGLASLLTSFFVVLCVLIPISALLVVVAQEARDVYFSIQAGGFGSLENILGDINSYIQGWNPDFEIRSYLEDGISFITSQAGAIFSGTAHFLASIFVGLVVMYYLFKDGARLRQEIIRLTPLEGRLTHSILDRLQATINSVIKGNLLIAFLQGVAVGIGFWIFGIPNAILWGAVGAIAALVPGLGTTLVMGPGVIFLYFASGWGAALGLFLWGAVVVGLIDEVLRPYVIGRDISIHPALVLLAVIGGLSVFGPTGFVLGPLVLSFFLVMVKNFTKIVNTKT